jgi:hypothetical protein
MDLYKFACSILGPCMRLCNVVLLVWIDLKPSGVLARVLSALPMHGQTIIQLFSDSRLLDIPFQAMSPTHL